MNLPDAAGDGSTPLDPDEAEGLIPAHISTRGELNEFESMNIVQGARWLRGRRPTRETVLTSDFVRQLHRRMFGAVWSWAGEFRHTEKSIGNVPPSEVPVQVYEALADAHAQLEGWSFSIDEVAMRLHHRLTQIHPFANGNGRTARYFVDELLKVEGRPAFTWGTLSERPIQEVRVDYIAALRAADAGEFDSLRAFVRS